MDVSDASAREELPPGVAERGRIPRAAGARVIPLRGRPTGPFRVAYLWDADYPWDVRVEKICQALTAAGHDVHIVARNRGRAAQREQLAEGMVHRMPPWPVGRRLDAALGLPAFFNPRWIRHLGRVVSDVQPDVIIARDLPLCPTAIHVGRRSAIPVIHDMAEHYPAMIREVFEAGRQRPLDYLVRNPRVVEAVERYCIHHADRILVVVEEMRDRLVAMGVPVRRIDVVSNTPPAARVVPRAIAAPNTARPLRLVYLGIMESPRGIDDLLEAAARLERSGMPVHVDLVGTGRDVALFQQHAQRLGVYGSAVRFHGHLASHEEALGIIARADIGVLPHRRCAHWDHTIPNKLFDYMAAGLPVLTSDAAPFARVVRETGCGEVFTSRDPASLAGAIRRLADPALRARYGAHGQRAILERYNWEADSEVLLASVARAILSGARAGAGAAW